MFSGGDSRHVVQEEPVSWRAVLMGLLIQGAAAVAASSDSSSCCASSASLRCASAFLRSFGYLKHFYFLLLLFDTAFQRTFFRTFSSIVYVILSSFFFFFHFSFSLSSD
jgi:hypothetical protein